MALTDAGITFEVVPGVTAGVAAPEFMDARSVLGIIHDTPSREPRDKVFTCFNYMNNYPEQDAKFPTYTRDLFDKFDNYRPMRAIHSTRYTYIWNAWADGKNEIPDEMSSEQTIRKILRATGHDDRSKFETFRTREEFWPGTGNRESIGNALRPAQYAVVETAYRRIVQTGRPVDALALLAAFQRLHAHRDAVARPRADGRDRRVHPGRRQGLAEALVDLQHAGREEPRADLDLPGEPAARRRGARARRQSAR